MQHAKAQVTKRNKTIPWVDQLLQKIHSVISDMARPLTKWLAHDCEFVWTNQCDISFQMLKDALCSALILKYPDTSKPYTLYTEASKYGWAGVLTQSNTSTVGGKEITMDHPVLYVSGLLYGSQLNWATLTKEAYAI